MTLNPRQIAILQRLASGVHSFDPKDYFNDADALTRLSSFQTVVAEIDRLYDADLIARPNKHPEKQSGHDWIDHVQVNGGLTDYGARVLAEHVPPR